MFKMKLLLMQRHYGIQISWNNKIRKGFYIGHYGTIVRSQWRYHLGNNVNISQGVTLGQANKGKHKGCPVIRNEVYYIGPVAKIIGKVTIGK